MQQPPHLLIRVQGGKTNVEGSSFGRGTTCGSGMHLAGTGIIAFDRSSPPNLSGKNPCLYPESGKLSFFHYAAEGTVYII